MAILTGAKHFSFGGKMMAYHQITGHL